MLRHRLPQWALLLGLISLSWLAAGAAAPADSPEDKGSSKTTRSKKADRKKEAGKAARVKAQGARQTGGKDAAKPTAAARQSAGETHIAPLAIHRTHVPDALKVAAHVDQLIAAGHQSAGVTPAPRTSDENFLRRVTFDLAGVAPTAEEVTQFNLDPNPEKRQHTIDRLLDSPEYAANWARYWRDVIFLRATETRPQFLVRSSAAFEEWMTAQLAANKPWHEIATALLTATGDVTEVGQTALVFAQRGEPDEVAAETSRIFLGIQIQCANCHDHPVDHWKREQFHGLAAFFPRIQVRPKRDEPMRTFEVVSLEVGPGGDRRMMLFEQLHEHPEQIIRRWDKNRDRKLSRDEMAAAPGLGRLLQRLLDEGDLNKDGLLSSDEMKKLEPPMMAGRGSPEYYMPDLSNPQSAGEKFDPQFFLGDQKPGEGLSDLDRRQSLANYIVSPTNPWFAKALVNRLWGQLVGEGFYMPLDDIGPDRTPTAPEALEALSQGFTASGYDLKWLLRVIANTETYQRAIRARDPQQSGSAFAAAIPTRLRGDLLYSALTRALGIDSLQAGRRNRPRGPDRDPRSAFRQLFGFDPSTPPDELTGTLPQALFLMNAPQVNGQIRARGNTRLAELLEKFQDDDAAIKELYLQVHAREPSDKELQICRDYLQKIGKREEAFEDIQWSLVNSTEFQSKH